MDTDKTKSTRLGPEAHGGILASRGAVFGACVAFLLSWVPVAPALAQVPVAADLVQCGKGNGKGADIRTCADEIMDEQERTIDLLDEMTQTMGAMGLLQADEMDAATRQLGFMRNSHGRGRKEKDDGTDAEFDALMVKSEASVCEFQLLPRFHTGPPPRAMCTDAQIAENKCEEVCEFSPSEQNRNNQRGLRLEEDLAEALQQTIIANDELANGMNSLAALSFEILSADGDPCGFDSPHPNLQPFPPASIMFHNQILVAQETITKIGEGACKQDAAGFNVSTACIVLSVLEGVQKGLTEFVNTVNGNFTSAKVDATFDCVRAMKLDIEGQGDQLGELESKVDAVTEDVAEVKALMDEIRSLLSTPQGLRGDFPTK